MKRLAPQLAALALLLGFLVGSTPADQEPRVLAPPSAPRHSQSVDLDLQYPVPYSGSAQPVRVRIPSLDIAANVNPVGMSDATTMQVPRDIRVVGWFDRSVLPASESGHTVLVGHRDGEDDPNGVFRNLSLLGPGDLIRIRDLSDRRIDYTVTEVAILSDEKFARDAIEIFATQGPHRLILITCGGVFDEARGGYQSNVVVTALLE